MKEVLEFIEKRIRSLESDVSDRTDKIKKNEDENGAWFLEVKDFKDQIKDLEVARVKLGYVETENISQEKRVAQSDN